MSTVTAHPSAQAYADLAALELEFDAAETQLLKHEIELLTPLYARRHAVLSTIPSFWQVIFENFGPDLDDQIFPEDWNFLSENLTSLDVQRRDLENPRSFEVILGFKKGNGVIKDSGENEVLVRKKFIFKSLRDGDDRWQGLTSEPVEIPWTSEKADLTDGISGLSKQIFELRKSRVEKKIEARKAGKSKEEIEKAGKQEDGLEELEEKLEEKMNQTQSFFNWFSWTGEYFMVMEKEAELVMGGDKKEEEEKKGKGKQGEEEDEEVDLEDAQADEIDVFPSGEKLAYLISENLFPHALKYFADAIESQEVNDDDEDDDEEDDEVEDVELDSDLEEQLAKGGYKGRNAHAEKRGNKRKGGDDGDDGDDEEMDGVGESGEASSRGNGKKKARK